MSRPLRPPTHNKCNIYKLFLRNTERKKGKSNKYIKKFIVQNVRIIITQVGRSRSLHSFFHPVDRILPGMFYEDDSQPYRQ